MELSPFDRIYIASFSSIEKQAIYQTLCAFVKLDGRVDNREMQILEEVKIATQITSSDIVRSRTLTLDAILNILRGMPELKKSYFMKFAALVCLADGPATAEEIAFFEQLRQNIDAPSYE